MGYTVLVHCCDEYSVTIATVCNLNLDNSDKGRRRAISANSGTFAVWTQCSLQSIHSWIASAVRVGSLANPLRLVPAGLRTSKETRELKGSYHSGRG